MNRDAQLANEPRIDEWTSAKKKAAVDMLNLKIEPQCYEVWNSKI
jgi:hypothetical protein